MPGVDEVLLPAETEARVFVKRTRDGIPIEGATWARLVEISHARGVAAP